MKNQGMKWLKKSKVLVKFTHSEATVAHCAWQHRQQLHFPRGLLLSPLQICFPVIFGHVWSFLVTSHLPDPNLQPENFKSWWLLVPFGSFWCAWFPSSRSRSQGRYFPELRETVKVK